MGKIDISPYILSDNEDLLKLEQLCPQGEKLSLKFVRPTFHARSEVYEDYKILTAKMEGKIIGVTAHTVFSAPTPAIASPLNRQPTKLNSVIWSKHCIRPASASLWTSFSIILQKPAQTDLSLILRV